MEISKEDQDPYVKNEYNSIDGKDPILSNQQEIKVS